MCCAGALPLLVAYLDVGRAAAGYAVDCLHCLCCSGFNACHQNLELLAGLKGVRRLSNVLCPRFAFAEGYTLQMGTYIQPLPAAVSMMYSAPACLACKLVGSCSLGMLTCTFFLSQSGSNGGCLAAMFNTGTLLSRRSGCHASQLYIFTLVA